jgi:hypothetical protein
MTAKTAFAILKRLPSSPAAGVTTTQGPRSEPDLTHQATPGARLPAAGLAAQQFGANPPTPSTAFDQPTVATAFPFVPFDTSTAAAEDPFAAVPATQVAELEGPFDAANVGDYCLSLFCSNMGAQIVISGAQGGTYEVGPLAPGTAAQLSDRSRNPLPVVVTRNGHRAFAISVHAQPPGGLALIEPNPR